jgi:hypothetical protein
MPGRQHRCSISTSLPQNPDAGPNTSSVC